MTDAGDYRVQKQPRIVGAQKSGCVGFEPRPETALIDGEIILLRELVKRIILFDAVSFSFHKVLVEIDIRS